MSFRPERTAARFSMTWPTAAVVVTAMAIGGVSSSLGNPDQIVTSGFVSALKSQSSVATAAGAHRGSGLVQLSGSEEFWLDARASSSNTVPVALKDALRLGDRVSFGTGADERRFEVVDIRSIGDAMPVAGSTHTTVPLLLITCRDPAAPDAPLMRFVIERAVSTGDTARRTPHAL